MNMSSWLPGGRAQPSCWLVLLILLCSNLAGASASESPLDGTRVGEASNLGPLGAFDDSDLNFDPEAYDSHDELHD